MTPQWGFINNVTQNTYISYPIRFTSVFSICGNDVNTDGDPLVLAMYSADNTKFLVTGKRISGGRTNLWGYWIALGII